MDQIDVITYNSFRTMLAIDLITDYMKEDIHGQNPITFKMLTHLSSVFCTSEANYWKGRIKNGAFDGPGRYIIAFMLGESVLFYVIDGEWEENVCCGRMTSLRITRNMQHSSATMTRENRFTGVMTLTHPWTTSMTFHDVSIMVGRGESVHYDDQGFNQYVFQGETRLDIYHKGMFVEINTDVDQYSPYIFRLDSLGYDDLVQRFETTSYPEKVKWARNLSDLLLPAVQACHGQVMEEMDMLPSELRYRVNEYIRIINMWHRFQEIGFVRSDRNEKEYVMTELWNHRTLLEPYMVQEVEEVMGDRMETLPKLNKFPRGVLNIISGMGVKKRKSRAKRKGRGRKYSHILPTHQNRSKRHFL